MGEKANRILIVEDSSDLSIVLGEALRDLGYDVLVSGNGREAIKLSGSDNFNLVILDNLLPDITGFEVARTLRELPNRPRILGMSAEPFTGPEGQKITDEELVKPFNLDKLVDHVRRLTGLPPLSSTQ